MCGRPYRLLCEVKSRRALWQTVCARKDIPQKGKLAGDDYGEQWRQRRLKFCKTHQRRTAPQWARYVQAVADFRYFVYYPRPELAPLQA